ncbi:MAG TPA: OstA-like protein [Saprospiraceae bacterium]|nr:OstA-like protein [Saprospiraceae bacterium]
MNRKEAFTFIGVIFMCTLSILGIAQSEQDSTDRIIVDYSDLAEYERIGDREQQILKGNVELHQDSNFMYCQMAQLTGENQLIAIDEVLIQQTDSVFLFCDSLYYYGNERDAELYGNVSLVNKTYQLFTEELFYELDTRTARYEKSALLTDGDAQLISKRGIYYVNDRLAVFSDSVIIIDSNFVLKTDSLEFNTATKICYFTGPTLIQQEEATIYCEAGYYNLNSGEALFTQNAEYLKGSQYSTADSMYYFSEGDEVRLIGNAIFEDSLKYSTADKITFWQDNETAILQGNAKFEEPDREIQADSIFYDARSERYFSSGRSKIWDGAQYLEAEEIDYATEKSWALATGQVLWKDTVENTLLISEEMKYKRSTGEFLSYTVDSVRPYMIDVSDGDSLWLSADTLYSFLESEAILPVAGDSLSLTDTPSIATDTFVPTLVDSTLFDSTTVDSLPFHHTDAVVLDSLPGAQDSLTADLDTVSLEAIDLPQSEIDSFRVLRAYNDVRMYKSDFQAVCDSLLYKEQDSSFYFYKEPVMWSDTSQFLADTIRVLTDDDGLDKAYLMGRAFILNSEDELFFNQMKGRHITAEFDSSEIRRMYVEGNAESVYYALDEEDAYIGVNYTQSSRMLVYFGNNQVTGIKYYKAPESVMTPMEEADHENIKLDGFRWITELRPGSKWDVINFRKKAVPVNIPDNLK